MSTASRLRQIVVITAVAGLTVAAAPAVAKPHLLWERSYDGGAGHHDYARGVVTAKNAIYVTGSTQDSDSPPDFTVLRYSLGGELKWQRHRGGTDEVGGRPSDIAAAPNGGVIVTGFNQDAAGWQVSTVEYSPRGKTIWRRDQHVDGTIWPDRGPKIAVADDGSVRVSATSGGNFLVLAYAPDGAKQWARQVDASDGQDDIATDVAVDQAGNVYVVGEAGGGFGGFSTAKIKPSGRLDWVVNEHGPFGSTLGPAFIDLGPDDLPVVSAVPESTCGLFQSRTWKLDASGTQLWTSFYPEDPCGSIEAVGMRVRDDGSVVVLGTELPAGSSGFDFTTISYDADGNQEWAERLDYGSVDLATALTVDHAGNAYVTGVGSIGMPENDALTASYSRAGRLRWLGTVDTDSQSERPAGIAMLRKTVVVTGDYFDPARLDDVFTLRYRQPR